MSKILKMLILFVGILPMNKSREKCMLGNLIFESLYLVARQSPISFVTSVTSLNLCRGSSTESAKLSHHPACSESLVYCFYILQVYANE